MKRNVDEVARRMAETLGARFLKCYQLHWVLNGMLVLVRTE